MTSYSESVDVTCPGPDSCLTYYSEYTHRTGDLHIEGVYLQKELAIKNHHSTQLGQSQRKQYNKTVKYVCQLKPVIYLTGLVVDTTLPPTYSQEVRQAKNSPVETYKSALIVKVEGPSCKNVFECEENNTNVPTYLGRLNMTGAGQYYTQCCLNIGQGIPWPCIKS